MVEIMNYGREMKLINDFHSIVENDNVMLYYVCRAVQRIKTHQIYFIMLCFIINKRTLRNGIHSPRSVTRTIPAFSRFFVTEYIQDIRTDEHAMGKWKSKITTGEYSSTTKVLQADNEIEFKNLGLQVVKKNKKNSNYCEAKLIISFHYHQAH